MWLGLGLLFTALLRFVPVLGNLGRKAIAALTLVLALFLTVFTSSISALFHNLWTLAALVLLVVVGLCWWQKRV